MQDRPLSDINTADPASTAQVFTWERENSNYIGLSARTSDYAEIDNLAIRKLPLAPALATEYALDTGLTSAASALTADPDNDGDNNLQEWLQGSSPIDSNDGRQLLWITPSSTGEFRFNYYRLTDAPQAGIVYTFRCSTNLLDWVEFSPEELGREPDLSGYEWVQNRVPNALGAGKQTLFVSLKASGSTP